MSSSPFEKWFDTFSRTGNISPLSLGMHRQQLADMFGLPEDWSAGTGVERAAIWKYGSLEFHFEKDGQLRLIYMDTPDAVVVSIPRVRR
jgi:hypothetical protein